MQSATPPRTGTTNACEGRLSRLCFINQGSLIHQATRFIKLSW